MVPRGSRPGPLFLVKFAEHQIRRAAGMARGASGMYLDVGDEWGRVMGGRVTAL
jgi:hypothetical protein